MRIRSLRLSNFKRFEDYEIVFGPGMNVVIGGNESGKSSIVEALAAVLYENPASKAQALRSLERWGSVGAMRLELSFDHEEQSFRLVKDFGAGRVELREQASGGVLTDRTTVDRYMGEMLGFPDRDAFESVAAVRQGEIASFAQRERGSSGDQLLPMIERKMTSSSGRVDAAAVLESLRREIAKMRVGLDRPARNPGPIKRLLDERSRMARRIEELRDNWDAVLSTRASLSREREELAERKTSLEHMSSRISDQEERRAVAEELARVEESLSKIEGKIGRMRKLRGDLRDIMGEKDRISPRDEETVKNARAEVEVMTKEIEALRERAPVKGGTTASRTGIATLLLAALSALLFTLPRFIDVSPPFNWVFYACGAVAGLSAFGFLRLAIKTRAFEREMAQLHQERSKRDLALQAALFGTGVPTYEEFAKLVRSQEDRWQRAEVVRAELSGESEGRDPEQYEEKLQADAIPLARRKTELLEEAARIGGANGLLEPEDLQKLREERDDLQVRTRDLEARVQKNEGRLEREDIGEPLPELEARFDAMQIELGAAERRVAVMERARDGLDAALSTTKEEAAEVLEPIVARLLSEITGGRYRTVSVARDLGVSVGNPESRPGAPTEVEARDLSIGTVDQLYLAARYALLEFLSPGDGAPFVLDEVLVNADPSRRSAAHDMLRRISSDRQVILFSCEGRGTAPADNVVNLDGPSPA